MRRDNMGHVPARSWRAASRGFTLIELLTVVSIIAVLMAILMPALNRARSSAASVQCLSNLKQWGVITRMYFEDSNRSFWPHQNVSPYSNGSLISWNHYQNYARQLYMPSLAMNKWYNGQAINGCSTKTQDIEHGIYTYRHWSYGVNYHLTNPTAAVPDNIPAKEQDVRNPVATPWIADVVSGPGAGVFFGFYKNQITRVGYVHPGNVANVLYVDGHAEPSRAVVPASLDGSNMP